MLTPVQFARVHLETYPAGVDVVALCKCVSKVMPLLPGSSVFAARQRACRAKF